MKKTRIATIALTVVLMTALVVWGTWAGSEEVMGAITAEGNATIVVQDQIGSTDAVTVDLVDVPRDSFIVVHQADGDMPGELLGYTTVSKGETRDIRVELDPEVPLTPSVIVAAHVDSGLRGVFEFDMEDMMHSPDKPYFIDGVEVATSIAIAEFGVPVGMDDAMIEVSDQRMGDEVVVASVMAPADAFVVVHLVDNDGMPGERLGYTAVPAGESANVVVELDEAIEERTKLIAALHADQGVAGEFEFDMSAPVDSPDQPFFADGHEVAAVFDVGVFGVDVERASISATDQIGATDSIVVEKVVVPAAGWIVVHKDAGGAPGERIGLKRVVKGTASDVSVPLDTDVLTENVFIAVHADEGTSEVFDFDMMDKLGSPDQPFFVDGEEVAVAIKVREFGIPVGMDEAMIEAVDQPVRRATIKVDNVMAPGDAWIVVHLDMDGMPGRRVGLAWVPKGMTMGTVVQLDASVALTEKLLIALHADRGEPQVFEFNMADGVNSPDQPYFTDGMEVAVPIAVR